MIGLIKVLVLVSSLSIPGMVFSQNIAKTGEVLCGRLNTLVATKEGKWSFPRINVAYTKVSDKDNRIGLVDGTTIRLPKETADLVQRCMMRF